MTLTCKRAGDAKHCADCAFAKWNQVGKPAGQPISPSVRKDATCGQYRQVTREVRR